MGLFILCYPKNVKSRDAENVKNILFFLLFVFCINLKNKYILTAVVNRAKFMHSSLSAVIDINVSTIFQILKNIFLPVSI